MELWKSKYRTWKGTLLNELRFDTDYSLQFETSLAKHDTSKNFLLLCKNLQSFNMLLTG